MSNYEEVDAGDTVWRFDRDFLASNWTCIWGKGCKGINATADESLGHGCCSLGAELDGIDEARDLSAAAATIPAHLFQFHAEANSGTVFADESYSATRVVDGACIFHNRNGFAGGEGCALHLAAEYFDESPTDWKPSVCWQLPIKVDWEMREDNVEIATVRRWSRADWGDHGTKMAWCCTEGSDAYVGESSVIDSLSHELSGIVGTEVFVQLRNRLK
ncbi:MAG: hypothetical protein NWQ72_06055 [Ilumatobacteraceae bacterium]|nr:hypothetical protein [Ilumatobacteraceae bacterium]MDP5068072.1 hypothetical protein [Ilumatobacteraceae bacterium]